MAQRIRPALILMDLKMPGKSGFELAFEFRDKPELADVPVVAMSGVFRSQKIPLLELSGIRRCLSKPLNPLDVIWTIEEILASKSDFSGLPIPEVSNADRRAVDVRPLLGRFDDLLMEMAGMIDLPTLAEMSEKLERLRDYKECVSKSLARPSSRPISRAVTDPRCATNAI